MSPFITPPFVRRIEEGVQTWESVCWGVKDPLSPKPSPVHPTESPDGVIQPSWSLANSYSHSYTDTHTQRGTQRESHRHPLPSLKSPQQGHAGRSVGEKRCRGGNSVVFSPQGKVTFAWVEACRSDTRTAEGTGQVWLLTNFPQNRFKLPPGQTHKLMFVYGATSISQACMHDLVSKRSEWWRGS